MGERLSRGRGSAGGQVVMNSLPRTNTSLTARGSQTGLRWDAGWNGRSGAAGSGGECLGDHRAEQGLLLSREVLPDPLGTRKSLKHRHQKFGALNPRLFVGPRTFGFPS